MKAQAGVLEFRGITRRFGQTVACNQIDLTVRRGEIHGLVGQNGAGKSTLMKILFGMLEPDEGSIEWMGQSVRFASPHEAVDRGIGMVQQKLCLADQMTILENVIANHEPGMRGFVNMSAAEARLKLWMEQFGVDLPLRKTVAQAQLGIAQRQLVEILRLLWREIDLLILDEPTSSLGPIEIAALFDVLRELREKGVTVIIISHRLSEVLDIANRVTVLRDGAVIGTLDRSEATEALLAKMMFGVSNSGERSLRSCSEAPVFEGKSLCGDTITDLSFSVCDGEVLGVAALPLNGGEELAAILGGTTATSSGSLLLEEREIGAASPRERAKAGLAYIPEDSIGEGTVAQFSVAENFILGRTREFRARRLGIPTLRWRQIFRNARILRDGFEVKYDNLKQPISTLSGGNIQRMMVARGMAADPKVLVMMHPTKCLDVSGAGQVMDWVHERISSPDVRLRAAVIISPDLEELVGSCHRIVVLYRGRSAGEFDGQDLDEHAIAEIGSLLTGGHASITKDEKENDQ